MNLYPVFGNFVPMAVNQSLKDSILNPVYDIY